MSISLLLEMAASGHEDRVALGTAEDGITFSDLADRVARMAGLVSAMNPTHLVHIGRNGPAFPQLLFAAGDAGVPFVPVSYRLTSTQVTQLLDQLDDPLVVVDLDYKELVDPSWHTVETAEFLIQAHSVRVIPTPGESPVAVLLFTSGTTSTPKAVVLTHDNLTSYVFSTVEFGSASADEAALVAVPPYHVAAVGSVLSNLYAGRRVVYLPDFDPGQWLDLVGRERVSTAMVVPTMLARIVEHLDGTRAEADSLKLISYGGARMPRPVLEKALEAFPNTGFCNAYGLTETSSTISLLGPEDHRAAIASDDPVVRARLASAGRLVPGIEAEIRGTDGAPVAAAETGELWLRGPQVAGEYLGRGSAVDADGWFHTRDLARFDGDGYLFIEGRADDTIIRGGENIAPAEIEDVLVQHPAVKEVAVVGVPDDEWGERIVAVIVLREGASPTADEIRGYVRERLRSSRTPDEVTWRPELPHNATGKLLRRQIVCELTEPKPLPTS